MNRILRSTPFKSALAAGTVLAVFAGGMAYAGNTPPVTVNGGTNVQAKVVTNVDGYTVGDFNTWNKLTGSEVTVNVPAGKSRMVTATFSAESSCDVQASGEAWCSVRIMAQKSGGSPVQLHPRVGDEFAFDSYDADEPWHGNFVSRSMRLGSSGTWKVWVELQKYAVGKHIGGMFIEHWHFQVETYK